MKDFATIINGRTLEYLDDEHIYIVDGVIVPSITEILKTRFGKNYNGVSRDVLRIAAEAGTMVHDAIDNYCKTSEESPIPELRNFKFLKKKYNFEVEQSEVPVILTLFNRPIAAGRCDLVLIMSDMVGGADIKRTSQLDKDYLFYQLNLYRIAYNQSYGIEWEFLKGIQLKGDKRKFVDIPINEKEAWSLVREYLSASSD